MKTARLVTGLVLIAAWSTATLGAEGGVARAQFTTAIEGREPADRVDRLGTRHDRVVFFTELRGLEGNSVRHRWVYDGEVRATVDFDVGGPRWRVWSSKELAPAWTGTWTVEVFDSAGGYHGSWTFTYVEQAAEEMQEPADAPDEEAAE